MNNENNELIITGLSILYAFTLILVKYIITQKDKQTETMTKYISDIKDILVNVQTNSATIKQEMEHNTHTIRSITIRLDDLTRAIHAIELNHAHIKEWKSSVDKQLEDLNKKINER